MDDRQEVIHAARTFILEQCLPGESPANLRDDARLVSSGILDSLAALGLADFVQRRFGIELTASDTMAPAFDRIDDIAALVIRKRAA
jgi:acyl carrier protein